MTQKDTHKGADTNGVSATILSGQANRPALAQISAVQRFRVGEFTVTSLSDGYLELVAGLFPSMSEESFNEALENAFLQPGAYKAALNAFVIDNGQDIHLIDAGGGPMAPTVGRIEDSLQAAGYQVDQVKTLIMTHLHPDHIGGALHEDRPRFPNAEMVVHAADYGFWTNEEIKAQVPDDVKIFFDMAVGGVSAYTDRLRQFDRETEVVPGLTAVPLPGHTPGHTGYMLSSGNDTLMIWGDIVHAPPLQFANPAASIAFDVDADAAAATRAKVFDRVSTDRLMVAGAHLTFPGVGYVVKSGTGYEFKPAAWQYLE